ncbi:ATP-binding protein [Anaerophilus nitritogenes]|uniref:ATP-binding protein n=1 Tax=Anaerophilus nitritogenes TaxID=2498136 RepID=UPI00101BFC97|nr:ATP-binding protein [Anaerophilus nitritogenes]
MGQFQTIQTSYECPICKDTEIVESKDDKWKFVSCKCAEVKRYKKMIQRSQIGNQFLKIGFKEFETNGRNEQIVEAKAAAIDYVKNFEKIRKTKNNSIGFFGMSYKFGDQIKKVGIGAGKTHLSIAIANNLMKKGIGVMYFPYKEAVLQLKQNRMDEEFYQREAGKYKTSPVLLVDDLFKGKITEPDKDIMFEILNYRYLNCLPVIVSSELSLDDLIDIDEAAGSRIIQMTKNYAIQFKLSIEDVRRGASLNYRLR